MKEENVGNTLVITSRYLKDRNGEKRAKDLREKNRPSYCKDEEFHIRRTSKRRE